MVVLPSNRVERRLIFVGPIVGGELIVEKGLDPGERIIVHGINKVYHGSLADPVTLQAYEAELEAREAAQLQGKSAADIEAEGAAAAEAVVEDTTEDIVEENVVEDNVVEEEQGE